VIRKVANVNSTDSDIRLISTIAGTGADGLGYPSIYNGDNILASTAFSGLARNPNFDKNGNLYYADQLNHRIRKIDTNGIIITVAGNGTAGFSGDGEAATSAQLDLPRSVAIDDNGNIYISDRNNHRVRKVDINGIITTFAGTGEKGYSGDDGPAASAKISFAYQLEIHDGNLYFGDTDNHVVRKINKEGIITTIAGNGTAGFSGDGGVATVSQLNQPLGVDFDSNGNLYIVDYGNPRIRKN
jgi:NHL repeat.